MQELKTGDYTLINGKLSKTEEDIKTGAILLVSKDFNKIELSSFNNVLVDVFNGWNDTIIKIWAIKGNPHF